MSAQYLHNRRDFKSLILTLSEENGIIPALVEKDYWIMHVLHSLKQSGLQFELKGGTSLSKGFQIIERFSEDIDMHISPPLEAGFAQVTPNEPTIIGSWMYDRAIQANLTPIDNRAIDILCYHPGYTLVEKLQTISTKYRADQSEQNKGQAKINFMRQYYDVYHLLKRPEVVDFVATDEYRTHKQTWFRAADLEVPMPENQAFLVSDQKLRADYRQRYASTRALYYSGQPDFDEMLAYIATFLDRL